MRTTPSALILKKKVTQLSAVVSYESQSEYLSDARSHLHLLVHQGSIGCPDRQKLHFPRSLLFCRSSYL